jgi:hypothetical protein
MGNERLEEVVRSLLGRARPPAVSVPLAMDPDMWLNMVNVKPPYLVNLEVNITKKLVLEYKRYFQKCRRQLLRSMQQFVLEEQLEIICTEDDQELEEVMELGRVEFIKVYQVLRRRRRRRRS